MGRVSERRKEMGKRKECRGRKRGTWRERERESECSLVGLLVAINIYKLKMIFSL